MNTNRLPLPFALQTTKEEFDVYHKLGKLIFHVEDAYLTEITDFLSVSEVVCIQRLISLANSVEEIEVIWGRNVSREVFKAPCLFPLLSALICLDHVNHKVEGELQIAQLAGARRLIYEYRLHADFFSDVQILLCADNRGHGRPLSIYNKKTGGIIDRDEFEFMVETLLSTHTGFDTGEKKAIFFVKAVGTIVAELFENTEIHGRLGLDGRPISKNGLRGIIFKRVKIRHNGSWKKKDVARASSAKTPVRHEQIELDALEISIFDAGIGFYSGYTREILANTVEISREWDVVHKCMERHYESSLPDARSSHRAMGLYEVLRALQSVNGIIEVRSGRTYGYRTFVPGELKFQLEPTASPTRPNMPKPVLLDLQRQFVTAPTMHERLDGSSVRVLIPLI